MTNDSDLSKLHELEAEIRTMLDDWARGRFPSPTDKDYVLAAVEIYLPDRWPPEVIIDRASHRVYIRLNDETPEELTQVAEIVRDELMVAVSNG